MQEGGLHYTAFSERQPNKINSPRRKIGAFLPKLLVCWRKWAKPTLCGFYPRLGSGPFGGDVFADGNLVYLADWAGLRIFQYTGGDTAAPRWLGYR